MKTKKIIVGYDKKQEEIAVCYFERSNEKIRRYGETYRAYLHNDDTYMESLECLVDEVDKSTLYEWVEYLDCRPSRVADAMFDEGWYNPLENCLRDFDVEVDDNTYTFTFSSAGCFDMESQNSFDIGYNFEYTTEKAKELYKFEECIDGTDENWERINKLIDDCEYEKDSYSIAEEVLSEVFQLSLEVE